MTMRPSRTSPNPSHPGRRANAGKVRSPARPPHLRRTFRVDIRRQAARLKHAAFRHQVHRLPRPRFANSLVAAAGDLHGLQLGRDGWMFRSASRVGGRGLRVEEPWRDQPETHACECDPSQIIGAATPLAPSAARRAEAKRNGLAINRSALR